MSEVPMLRTSTSSSSSSSTEWALWDVHADYVEKRQLFLRSYHFSRKKSRMQRATCYAVKVRRIICARLRSTKRLPRRLWHRLQRAWCFRRRFRRLVAQPYRPLICTGDCSW